MSFQQLLQALYGDTQASLAVFRPELVLCGTIVLILLLRVVRITERIDTFYVALAGSALALWFAAPWQNLDEAGGLARQSVFTGMLVYDSLTLYVRVILLLFVVLFAIFTRISGVPDRDAAPDFFVLVLGATLGMCLMTSANHMLMVFLGVEMASVPSYALAGLLKGRRQSSEAALKYAVYGAGTAGVMLYGISLLSGSLRSAHIPTMTARLAEAFSHGEVTGEMQMVLVLGALMVLVGLSFKLSAVPFHFWCPDVFEGASAEVNAFLSVASKAAALGLLVRVALGFSYLPSEPPRPVVGVALMSVAQDEPPTEDPVLSSDAATPADLLETPGDEDMETSPTAAAAVTPDADSLRNPKLQQQLIHQTERNEPLQPVRDFLSQVLAVLAVVTCTFGNLAAYGQTNIKRMLAYSTIAHAGYMIMPVAAAIALSGRNPLAAEAAIGALTFYMGVYLFMNLGAFAVVAFLRNILHSEEIADYAGLVRRAPITVICFSLLMFSLIGLPPLAGFNGKFLIFARLVDAKMWAVLVIGGLNTAISLFYYLRVVKIMTIDPEPEHRLPLAIPFIPGTFVVAMTLPVVLLGVWWNGLNEWALAAARHLLYFPNL